MMKLANEHFDAADNDYGVITLAQACEEAGSPHYPSADIQREVRKVKRILEKISQE